MEDTTDPAVVELVLTVARLIELRLPGLVDEMMTALNEKIPELRTDDEDIRELMYASTLSNVTAGISICLHNISVEQIEVPAAAAYHGRRLAQRGVPVEALLRAYRIGAAMFIDSCLEVMKPLSHDPRLLLSAAQRASDRAIQYIDRISLMLMEIYEEERRLWTRRSMADRAGQVRAVLLDEELDATTAELLTGYHMHGVHLAVVAWVTTEDSGGEMESATRLIVDAAEAQPLAVLADDRTLWAWVSGRRAAADLAAELDKMLRRLGGSVRIALGSQASGLPGFRSSHHEAQNAKRVAVIRGDHDARVTTFADVAVSAFLARDIRAARRWVSGVLGELAVDDASMAELRRTMLSFLRTGASLTETAALLHLHKNTVRYRLRKATDIRGRAINEGQVDLEVALQACEHLGRGVLLIRAKP